MIVTARELPQVTPLEAAQVRLARDGDVLLEQLHGASVIRGGGRERLLREVDVGDVLVELCGGAVALGFFAEHGFAPGRADGDLLGLARANREPGAHGRTAQQRQDHDGRGGEDDTMAAREFLHAINRARRTRQHRVALDETRDVRREIVGRGVAAGAIFFQRLHHDPVEVAAQRVDQLRRIGAMTARGGGEFHVHHRREFRRGAHRLLLANRPAALIQPETEQRLGIKRRFAREQFVEQHAEAVDVRARVNVQPAHLCLLGTHVSWRADKGGELGE